MAESSVSEHGFNLKDAEHERGTNRYVFRYPETWYNSQAFAAGHIYFFTYFFVKIYKT